MGLLTERYSLYNKCLQTINDKILQSKHLTRNNVIEKKKINFIDPSKYDFHSRLENVEEVTTVYLEFKNRVSQNGSLFYEYSKTDTSNLLINDYYQPVGSDRLCKAVTRNSTKNYGWYYTKHCSTDKNMNNQKLNMELMNTLEFINKLPDIQLPAYVTYTIIVQNSILTPLGTVISPNMFLLPTKLPRIKKEVPKDYDKAPLYDRVFSLGEPNSGNIYHLLVDSLSKIVANLEFLQSNPDIKILVPGSRKKILPLFNIFKLNESRILSETVRAKIAYIPGTGYPCFPHLQNIQIFSDKIRTFIEKQRPLSSKRRSVVFIRRTRSRFFIKQKEVENMIGEMAASRGLLFEVFTDESVPDITVTMEMFNRAVLVFGPPGAGLVNIIFSQPPTIIFEVNCAPADWFPSLCYMRLAHALGHRYYGFLATKGCKKGIHVKTENLKKDLEFYMDQAVKLID